MAAALHKPLFQAKARKWGTERAFRRHCTISLNCKALPDSMDLLIIGPGVLGSRVGWLWKQQYPEATVVGETNTTNNHERLHHLGFVARQKDNFDNPKYPFVLFSAPPSGSEDYAAEVQAACKRWDGSGGLVFTGSAGVYAVQEGICTEDSEVTPTGVSARTDKLLAAEQAVLSAGGNVVRLVGLYHGHRGAHTFFLRVGTVDRNGQNVVNLIHYEDAASLAKAVLEASGSDGQFRGKLFLGADDHPITFMDMIKACTESGAFEGSVEFTQEGPGTGKRVDSSKTRTLLNWEPRYESFRDFMLETQGRDWYCE